MHCSSVFYKIVIQIRPAANRLKIVTYSFKNFPKLSPIILLCLAYYPKVILRRYTCIRNTSFEKIVEVIPCAVYDCSIRVYRFFITIIIII